MPSSVNSFLSRRSSPEHRLKFDPLQVADNHMEHYESTSIVTLRDSGKIFCPICLENRSTEDITPIEDEEYYNYVASLFETLHTYSEEDQLRRVVLTILEIMLPKRPLVLDRDDSFHQVLRVVYRLMNSPKYNTNEFVPLTVLLSGTSINFVQPLPLRSAWEAWEKLLDYSRKFTLFGIIDQENRVPENFTKIICGQATIIQTYLALVNRVAVDKVSDLVFVLYSKNKPDKNVRKYYEQSQITCLRFSESILYDNSEYLYRVETLTALDRKAISRVFGAFCECFKVAVRQNDAQFIEWIDKKDMIGKIHTIFYNHQETDYRENLYELLKLILSYHIGKDYGTDPILDDLILKNRNIQTSIRGLKQNENLDIFYETIVFYLVMNCVAIKTKSTYFKKARVVAVLSIDDGSMSNVTRRLSESKLLMRIYTFLVASVFKDTTGPASRKFIRRLWREMRSKQNLTDFREIFCHELKVFDWARTCTDFIALVDCDSIDYLLDRSLEETTNKFNQCLKNLLKNGPMRDIFCQYIMRDTDALFAKISRHGILKLDKSIIDEFNTWLPALLQERVVTYVDTSTNISDTDSVHICRNISKLLAAINLLIVNNQKFRPFFDEQFIMDFSKMIEQLYTKKSLCVDEKQILFMGHEFITLLIKSNNASVMQIIQYMEFTLFGYMYNFLSGYKQGDKLVESIAKVLLAYDNLDYPLTHRIDKSLYLMPDTALDWMMSTNRDMHLLSIRLMDRIYLQRELTDNLNSISHSTKICLVTSFLHMLATNVELVSTSKTQIINILEFEEFKEHPFTRYLLEKAPELKQEQEDEKEHSYLPPSPDISFESTDEGLFDDEQISVSRILEQLHEYDGCREVQHNIPRNTYLSKTLGDEPVSFPGTHEWERRAYEAATQNSSGTTQQTTPLTTQHTTQQTTQNPTQNSTR